LWAGLGYEAGV